MLTAEQIRAKAEAELKAEQEENKNISSSQMLTAEQIRAKAEEELKAEQADQFAFADAAKDDPWYVDIGNALYAAGDATIGNVYRFGKDVIHTPVDFVRGADNTIFGQQRLLFNYLQGDNEEIDKILAKGRERKPIEGNTTFGTWVRQAAESAPFLVENVLAGVGGGAVGSIAGPAGATAGGIAGAAATSYLQGWGEAFESLVNNDVDRDTAAKIATFAAAPYAGLDFFKMGPILKRIGAGKLIAKLTVPQILEMIKADKVLGSKVVKALGSGFIDTLQESAVEGLQGGTINAAEQYARGDWNTSEFIKSVKDDAVGSLGSMAVTIGAAGAIGRLRNRRQHAALNAELQSEEEPNTDLVKRSWDNEVGTPYGVTEEMPSDYQGKVAWATRFTPEARGEIVEEARSRALREIGKPVAELNGEEKRALGSLAKDYALEMLKEAHDFKLRLADLDPEVFAFEKVFANDLQRTPYAQNVEESNNEAEIDDAIWDDAEEVAGEFAQKFSKKTPTKKYSDLDDFLKNGIEKGKSTFFDFGELSPQAVERIKNDTGVDLKGYVHTLQGYGIIHGENRHSSRDETYSGQIPITREDWKLADKIVNEFDKVEKSPKKNLLNNEVLIFQKQIGDEIYYVAEIRTGRKKLVSATMYKHKAKKEGDHTNLKSLKGLQFTSDNALVPSPNYGQSQNFSENQEENAKYSKNFDEEEEIEGIFDKEEKKELKEIKREKAKWTNRDGSMKEGYLKAPNGHPTSLAEKQWLLARTPSFKKKYGDWETLAIINEVKQMPASSVEIHKSLDKKGIKEAFKGFGEVTNNRDGRKVVFPSASAGKIHYHKGFPTNTIIKNFKSLFENSIPIISEKEELREGHKEHRNFDGYEHYVSKININGEEYYIRFTVQKEHKGRSLIHSSFVSEVNIYKEGSNIVGHQETLGENKAPTFVDEKLADFLNSVNEKDVKIYLDKNGEPIMSDFGLPQVKESEPLVFKPILRPDLPLPKSATTKGEVAGIGDIRRWAMAAMGININLEADAGAGYLGVYKPDSDTINLRRDNINSPETLFHEIGHSLEKRFFNDYFSDNQKHPASRELFNYFKKQKNAKAYKKSEYVSEGFAEFVKEFILNQSGVAKKFPTTIRYFSAALENNRGLNEILDKIKTMVKAYQEATPAQKARSRIKSSDVEKTKTLLREKPLEWYNFITRHFADSGARLTELQRITNKLAGEEIADFDTIRRAIVQGGGNGQTELSLWEKQIDFNGKIVGKSLKEILNPVADRISDFELFLVSRRMVNLMQKNGYLKNGKYREGANEFCVKQSGFTLSEVQEFYNSADGKFRTASVLIDKFQQNSLQLLVDGGLVSKESAKEMAKNFGYVSFRRLMEFSNSEAGISSNSNSMPIRRMRGSQREIINPLETLIENAYIFRTIAAKNRVKLGLCKSVGRLGGSGRYIERDVNRVKGTEGSKWDFAQAVVDSGLAEDVLLADGFEADDIASMDRREQIALVAEKVSDENPYFGFMIWKNAVSPDPKNRVITVFKNGKMEAWKVNDEGVYDALSSLDETTGRLASEFLNALASVSKKINSITRTGATANLSFGIRNFVRDQFTASVFTKSSKGFIPFVTTLYRGVLPAILKSKSLRYREWVASGGYNASLVGGSKALSLESIARGDKNWESKMYREEHPVWGRVKAVGNAVIHPLQTLSEIFENATRIAEFDLLREEYIETHGKNAWENSPIARFSAANSSKDITVNFSESGRTAKKWNNTVWYFFNARMQGLRKTFGGYLPIDVPIALRYLAGDRSFKASHMYNEDAMVHLIRAVSQTAILMMLKAAYGADDDEVPEWKRETCWNFKFGSTIISIPKSYEALPIYEAVERMLGADRNKAYWNFFLTSQLDFQIIPSVLNPVVEHAANYSFFRGAPLISDFMKDTPARHQKYPSTSQAMQALSRGLSRAGVDVSPIILEHYLTGYTAGLGKEALWWIDKVGGDFGIFKKGLATYSDSPLNIAKPFKQNPLSPSGAVDDFYKIRSDMRGVMSTYNKILKGELSPSDMNARERRQWTWYNARKWQINQIDKELTAYNREIRATMESEELAQSAKRENIKEFVKKRNSLAKLAKSLKFSEEAYEKWRSDVLGD